MCEKEVGNKNSWQDDKPPTSMINITTGWIIAFSTTIN
jgi:hypothetical protein